MEFLTYLFWPNPYAPDYSSTKVVLLLLVCVAFLFGSFALRFWRKGVTGVTKKLTRTWPSAAFCFGLVGLFLVVCRVEGISYLSMRVWWFVWAAAFVGYAFVQYKMYRARNYEVLPTEEVAEDPRSKYLPKKKKRS